MDTPRIQGPPKIVVSALQYLPIPVPSLKTVAFSNEASERLLALVFAERERTWNNVNPAENVEVDTLVGQSLSQIGIDMVEYGELVRAS